MPFQLTSREIATLLWVGVFAAWALRNRGVRRSAARLVRTAAEPFLVLFFLLSGAYAAFVVWFLSWGGVWSPIFLKETLLWFLLIALVTAGRGISSYEKVSYGAAVVDSFRIVVVVQFFVGLVPFSLPVELALVPTAAMIGLGLAAAGREGIDPGVGRFFRGLEVALGFAILAGALWNAVESYRTLATSTALISFILPPLLSLFFIPAVFMWTVYARYEWLFGKLRGDRSFRLWARWQLIRRLGLRPQAVLEFGRKYAFDLPAVSDADGFRSMLISPSWRERQDTAMDDQDINQSI